MSLTKTDGKTVATIELYSDQISKDAQMQIDKKNLVSHLKKEMKVFYECKLKPHESEIKKQLVEHEKSLNKLIYKCIDQLDIPLAEKVKFLQMNRQDLKIEFLLTQLSNKTENVKSVVDLEEKVRQDMIKIPPKKSSNNLFPSMRQGSGDLSEIQEKINSKNLPENVKEEIQK